MDIDTKQFVGLTLKEAREKMAEHGPNYSVRVVCKDGLHYNVIKNIDHGRLNVTIENDRIVGQPYFF